MKTCRTSISRFTNPRADEAEHLVLAVSPDTGSVTVELEVGGWRASAALHAEEVARLQAHLASIIQSNGGAVIFAGQCGEILSLAPTNWGEPYETGVRFTMAFGAPYDHNTRQADVDLPSDEARRLLVQLREIEKVNRLRQAMVESFRKRGPGKPVSSPDPDGP